MTGPRARSSSSPTSLLGTSCTGTACTPAVGVLAGGLLGNVMNAVFGRRVADLLQRQLFLYMRQNGSTTVQVDAPASGAPVCGGLLAASAGGSKVFFTDDSSAGLTSNTQSGSGANLYEYDLSTNTLTDLTPTKGLRFRGSSGSADGSYVYYVALGSCGWGDQRPAQPLRAARGTKFIATLVPPTPRRSAPATAATGPPA